MIPTKAVLAGALALFLATLLPPCAQAETLRIGIGPELETLDPHRGLALGTGRVLQELCEGLLTRDSAGRTVPGTATGWDISADGREWRFHLRPDARWWNGDAVTADDFVRGWRRAVDPATRSGIADLLDAVENAPAIRRGELTSDRLGVEALDAHNLLVRLSRPMVDFDMVLAHRVTLPVHGPTLQAAGTGFGTARAFMCNGPYRLADHRLQESYRLIRADHYHGRDQVLVESIDLVVSENPDMEMNLFRAGQLHVTSTMPGAMVDWARGHMPDSLHIHPWTALNYLRVNLNGPAWRDNPAFLTALALAIDREQIAATSQGRLSPAYGLVPPGLWQTQMPPAPVPEPQMRLAAARAALAQAGYGEGKTPPPVELIYAGIEAVRRRAVSIAAQWKQVLGVETILVAQEPRIITRREADGDYPGFIFAGWVSYAPSYAISPFLPPGAETSTTEQGLHAQERAILESHHVLPLLFSSSQRMVSPRVQGWQDNVYDIHPISRLSLTP